MVVERFNCIPLMEEDYAVVKENRVRHLELGLLDRRWEGIRSRNLIYINSIFK
jgi:hypothetical protein